MKTVLNKTREPVKVPLPRGKVLHLGPNKTGQISHKDVDHEPLQRLVKAGKIEIQGDGPGAEAEREHHPSPHADTHGHHPPSTPQVRGDR